MRSIGERGLTLIELLLAVTGMAIISAAAAIFLTSTLGIEDQGTSRSELYREGLSAMERMKEGVKRCTSLHIPNSHSATRDVLAFSGSINDDNDFYFADPLFPRVDEDLSRDINNDAMPGITGVDDDGDGLVDEGDVGDDDEDGSIDEDPVDGIDNDGDGSIDEDGTGDLRADTKSGIKDMDDDGDGQVDEHTNPDDDEDGLQNEDSHNYVIYSYSSGTNTLTESVPSTGQSTVLLTNITQFQVTYQAPDATHGPRVLITLTVTDDDGASISFSEYVYPENILQRLGRRVR